MAAAHVLSLAEVLQRLSQLLEPSALNSHLGLCDHEEGSAELRNTGCSSRAASVAGLAEPCSEC